jgi:large subunit ribosomal protein L7/L12
MDLLSRAAQYLLKKGEVLEPVTPENRPPMVEFSPELLLRPTPYVKNLADRTLELTQIEMNQLSERLRVRIGISDADFHGSPRGKRKKKASSDTDTADANLAPAEPVKVKEFFDVKIGAVDPKSKIKIIKEVRTITNLGLKEVCIII